MSLLFVAPGWDEGPWRKRFAALLPGHTLVTPETLVDRAAVRSRLTPTDADVAAAFK